MSDLELVRLFRERLAAVWLAYLEYQQANADKAGDVVHKRNAVDQRNRESRDAVCSRLDELAAKHTPLESALKLRKSLPSPSAPDAERHYNKIPPCVEQLENNLEPRLQGVPADADTERNLKSVASKPAYAAWAKSKEGKEKIAGWANEIIKARQETESLFQEFEQFTGITLPGAIIEKMYRVGNCIGIDVDEMTYGELAVALQSWIDRKRTDAAIAANVPKRPTDKAADAKPPALTGANAGEGADEKTPNATQTQGTPPALCEPSDRQRLILRTMLENEVTSRRRRKKQADIVRLINRKHKAASYGRDFSALVKQGYLESTEGPTGGMFIIPNRKAEVEQILKD